MENITCKYNQCAQTEDWDPDLDCLDCCWERGADDSDHWRPMESPYSKRKQTKAYEEGWQDSNTEYIERKGYYYPRMGV